MPGWRVKKLAITYIPNNVSVLAYLIKTAIENYSPLCVFHFHCPFEIVLNSAMWSLKVHYTLFHLSQQNCYNSKIFKFCLHDIRFANAHYLCGVLKVLFTNHIIFILFLFIKGVVVVVFETRF